MRLSCIPPPPRPPSLALSPISDDGGGGGSGSGSGGGSAKQASAGQRKGKAGVGGRAAAPPPVLRELDEEDDSSGFVSINSSSSMPSSSASHDVSASALDLDLDMSTESALGGEEHQAALLPTNTDLGTRRRQTAGCLSMSCVPGDVVAGGVGFAVATVFDPLLLSHVLGFLSFRELLRACAAVSRAWCHTATKLASMIVVSRVIGAGEGDEDEDDDDDGSTSTSEDNNVVFSSWAHFARLFPKGSYIAKGGSKTVYRVWADVAQRWEAMAVVDVAVCQLVSSSISLSLLPLFRPLSLVLSPSSSSPCLSSSLPLSLASSSDVST